MPRTVDMPVRAFRSPFPYTMSSVKRSAVEQSPAEGMQCPVCSSTLFPAANPKIMSAAACEHVFCGSCIDRIEGVSKSCPMCKRVSRAVPLKERGFAFRSWLASHVECVSGCGWKGEMANFEAHVRNCNDMKCIHCNEVVVPPHTVEEHVRSACDVYKTACRNNGCSAILSSKQLVEHVKVCEYRQVSCTVPGCTYKGPFITIWAHRRNSWEFHEECYLKRISELQADAAGGIRSVLVPAAVELAESESELDEDEELYLDDE